jgi:HAD superfamily hydrolase (TIGR01490 family)
VRKAAIFDIDGTIIKGISSERVLFYYLLEKRVINFSSLLRFAAAFLRKCFSLKGLSFRKNKYYLKNNDYENIIGNIDECFHKRILPHISEYALQEIKRLKNEGYLIILLSGTLSPMVECFTKVCNADIGIGTKLAVDNEGRITGEIDGIHSYCGGKVKIIERLVSEYSLDLSSSYGFGNAYVDVKFLRIVGYPVAVNASPMLWLYARANQWKMVTF